MANELIREHAKKNGVYLWELAARYRTSDSYFSKKMRFEFSQEEQEKALRYIDEIAKER